MLAVFRRGTFSFRIKPHQKPPQATQEQSPPPDCHTTTATARRQPIQVDEPHPSCSTRTSCLLSISSDAFLEEYTSSINTCCIESMNSGRTQRGGNKLMDPVVDNPFESRGILNKKHDVFNRRVKGEKRNVARARGQATQRREKTLLVDYERNQKANSFRDKRWRPLISM